MRKLFIKKLIFGLVLTNRLLLTGFGSILGRFAESLKQGSSADCRQDSSTVLYCYFALEIGEEEKGI